MSTTPRSPKDLFLAAVALERRVQLYDATGQKAKADEWRKQLEATKAAMKPPMK
jgi:hypothetical protein